MTTEATTNLQDLHTEYKSLYGKGVPVNKIRDAAWIEAKIMASKQAEEMKSNIDNNIPLQSYPVPPVAPVAPVKTDNAELNAKQLMNEDMIRTKKFLDAEVKVPFYIQLQPGEPRGLYESVTINGYRTEIKKGEMVMIPRTVFDMLVEKYNVGVTAGQEFLIGRNSDTAKALS